MKRTLSLALTAAAIAAAPCAVAAQTAPAATPPVAVRSCAFAPRTLLPNGSQGRITIAFAAVGAAVSQVTFRVFWGDGESSDLVDGGTFSPNVTIAHDLVFDRNGPISAAFYQTVEVGVLSVSRGKTVVWDAPATMQRSSCEVLRGGF